MPNLSEKYKREVVPALQAAFGYKNTMAVPRIVKIVVNTGVGRLREDHQRTEIQKYLALLTGQRAAARPTKKAIASFKTREGLVVGYQVTLRGKRMYDFLTRLADGALPRTRDFKGIALRAVDAQGNLTLGIKEHIIFPEMIGEDYKLIFGFEATVVTSAHTRAEGIALLRLMGLPLQTE
ncbi:MAG: 50S ribosomal protein L5 [bacterium]|nr:50S ribosomal protein L5 [bacterium]MDZ4299457.1 50S ribosomal protein L5 [Candidatus Sungbacteria bacterium]